MTESNMYDSFSISLCEALSLLAKEAIQKSKCSVGTDPEDFHSGYLSCFHRVITLIQQQAEIYDIPLEELRMDKLKESDFF